MVRSAGMNDEWSQQKPKMEKHKTGAALQILVFACEPFALFKFVSKSKTWPQRPLVLNSRSSTLRAAKKPQLQGNIKSRSKQIRMVGRPDRSVPSKEGLLFFNMFELFWMLVGPFQYFPWKTWRWSTFLFCFVCCWQVDWAKKSFCMSYSSLFMCSPLPTCCPASKNSRPDVVNYGMLLGRCDAQTWRTGNSILCHMSEFCLHCKLLPKWHLGRWLEYFRNR